MTRVVSKLCFQSPRHSLGEKHGHRSSWSYQVHRASFLRYRLQNKPTAEKILITSGLGDACVHPSSNLPGNGQCCIPRRRAQAAGRGRMNQRTFPPHLGLSAVRDPQIHVPRTQRDEVGCGKWAREVPARPRRGCAPAFPLTRLCTHACTDTHTHRHTHTRSPPPQPPHSPAYRRRLQLETFPYVCL